MKKIGTLDDAAALFDLSRDEIYRVAVQEGRIPAKLIRGRRNGRMRPRWMLDLRAAEAYFSKETVLRDNRSAKGGAR